MKKNYAFCIPMAFVLISMWYSCADKERGRSTVSGKGIIVHVDLEGGFYGIVSETGERYDPLDLPDEFREDSISVYFEGTPKENMVTFRQWGTALELSTIRRISGKTEE